MRKIIMSIIIGSLLATGVFAQARYVEPGKEADAIEYILHREQFYNTMADGLARAQGRRTTQSELNEWFVGCKEAYNNLIRAREEFGHYLPNGNGSLVYRCR